LIEPALKDEWPAGTRVMVRKGKSWREATFRSFLADQQDQRLSVLKAAVRPCISGGAVIGALIIFVKKGEGVVHLLKVQ
jgi:hypothetical protein